MEITESKIILEDLHFYAHHGATPLEQKVGGHYRLTVSLYINITEAAASDRLSQTLDYSAACQLIHREMQQPSNLLEHVCGRIVEHLFCEFHSLQKIDLKLTKENPPMYNDGGSAAIELHAVR